MRYFRGNHLDKKLSYMSLRRYRISATFSSLIPFVNFDSCNFQSSVCSFEIITIFLSAFTGSDFRCLSWLFCQKLCTTLSLLEKNDFLWLFVQRLLQSMTFSGLDLNSLFLCVLQSSFIRRPFTYINK